MRRGSVLLARLDPTVGHEQRGRRPCVVVSDPEVISNQRFPMLCIIPITGAEGTGALYPALASGPHSGLSKTSYALVDQLRCIDKRRVERLLGQISLSELEAIESGIHLYLAL